MLNFDKTTNLLMQAKYHYSLQDVEEPNLYREIYATCAMCPCRCRMRSG